MCVAPDDSFLLLDSFLRKCSTDEVSHMRMEPIGHHEQVVRTIRSLSVKVGVLGKWIRATLSTTVDILKSLGVEKGEFVGRDTHDRSPDIA